MFRSSLAIGVGGSVAASAPALTELIPQPELRGALVGLAASLCIAAGDAVLRSIHAKRKSSRAKRRRKARAIPPAQQTKSE